MPSEICIRFPCTDFGNRPQNNNPQILNQVQANLSFCSIMSGIFTTSNMCTNHQPLSRCNSPPSQSSRTSKRQLQPPVPKTPAGFHLLGVTEAPYQANHVWCRLIHFDESNDVLMLFNDLSSFQAWRKINN